MLRVEKNGIILCVEQREKKKLPVLSVRFEGEDDSYPVAYFKDITTALWFTEIFLEFYQNKEEQNT